MDRLVAWGHGAIIAVEGDIRPGRVHLVGGAEEAKVSAIS